MGQARVRFRKLDGGRYGVDALRPDGATVHMPTSDRKFRIPHGLAHFAVERELRLADGVFGTVMAGGLFDKMRVTASPRRADEQARGAAIVRSCSADGGVTVAEVLAGIVHHAVETGERSDLFSAAQEQWGTVKADPFPYNRAQIEAARSVLADLDRRWIAVPLDGELLLHWTVPSPKSPGPGRPRRHR